MKASLVVIAAIVGLVGCAINDGRPVPGNFVVNDQNKLKSAAHWRVVAEDVANQFSLKSSGQSVYVVPADVDTTFSKVFASQLKSSLAANGYTLSQSKAGAIEISVTVDEVQHVTLKRYAPGTLSVLAAGVLVLRDFTETARQAVGAIAGITLATDAIISANEITKRSDTEIVLTTVATKDGVVLMHTTNVYYLDSADTSLFTNSTRQFKLVGGAK